MDKIAAQPIDSQGWIINPDGTKSPPFAAYGKELVNSALLGAGVTGGATALYHLINGFNSAQLPTLVRNEVPQAAKVPAKRKPRKSVKVAADGPPATDRIFDAIGRLIPSGYVPGSLPAGSSGPASMSAPHIGWRYTANMAATGAGALGGLTLAQNLAAKKKKKDLAAEVDAARQQYFDALHGKKAAALDMAYETTSKCGGDFSAAYNGQLGSPDSRDTLDSAMRWTQPLRNLMSNAVSGSDAQKGTPGTDLYHTLTGTRASGDAHPATNWWEQGLGSLWGATTAAALGTGTLGAMYMYNQTKARSKAENLRRAQASRARLQALHQTPWVDPDELAALAK